MTCPAPAVRPIPGALGGSGEVPADAVFGYVAGTGVGTVNVPAGATVRHYTAAASAAGIATISINDGPVITIPASLTYDEYPAGLTGPATIAFGGAGLAAWEVSWWT